MAIVNGTVSISGKSVFTATSTKTNINALSKINSNSTVNIGQSVIIKKSTVSIGSKSSFSFSGGTLLRKIGNIAINSVSSFSATIIKVGKEYFNKITLSGNIINSVSLKGGGESYMLDNQNFNLIAGDYLEISVTILDEVVGG
jgi:hypothetical protein